MVAVELLIPYIGPSTNSIYAGIHWQKRKKHKADALKALKSLGFIPQIDAPVQITMKPMLGKGKRAYDVSNYSYTYKMLEDCLVECGVLVGDTSKTVKRVLFESPVKIEGKESFVKLAIETIADH